MSQGIPAMVFMGLVAQIDPIYAEGQVPSRGSCPWRDRFDTDFRDCGMEQAGQLVRLIT